MTLINIRSDACTWLFNTNLRWFNRTMQRPEQSTAHPTHTDAKSHLKVVDQSRQEQRSDEGVSEDLAGVEPDGDHPDVGEVTKALADDLRRFEPLRPAVEEAVVDRVIVALGQEADFALPVAAGQTGGTDMCFSTTRWMMGMLPWGEL